MRAEPPSSIEFDERHESALRALTIMVMGTSRTRTRTRQHTSTHVSTHRELEWVNRCESALRALIMVMGTSRNARTRMCITCTRVRTCVRACPISSGTHCQGFTVIRMSVHMCVFGSAHGSGHLSRPAVLAAILSTDSGRVRSAVRTGKHRNTGGYHGRVSSHASVPGRALRETGPVYLTHAHRGRGGAGHGKPPTHTDTICRPCIIVSHCLSYVQGTRLLGKVRSLGG